MSGSVAHAPAVSRVLRAAGFMPSQPSAADPYPALQVRQALNEVVVAAKRIRHVPEMVAALTAASYLTEVGLGAGDAPWAYIRVWR